MQVVLSTNQRPHADDKQVTEAGDEGHDPDRHPQHHVSQEVLKRRDAICVGFTGPHMRCIGTVLKLLEIACREKRKIVKKRKKKKTTHKEEMTKHAGYSEVTAVCCTYMWERFFMGRNTLV